MLLDELDFPGSGVPDPRTGNIVVSIYMGNHLLCFNTNTSVLMS